MASFCSSVKAFTRLPFPAPPIPSRLTEDNARASFSAGVPGLLDLTMEKKHHNQARYLKVLPRGDGDGDGVGPDMGMNT